MRRTVRQSDYCPYNDNNNNKKTQKVSKMTALEFKLRIISGGNRPQERSKSRNKTTVRVCVQIKKKYTRATRAVAVLVR